MKRKSKKLVKNIGIGLSILAFFLVIFLVFYFSILQTQYTPLNLDIISVDSPIQPGKFFNFTYSMESTGLIGGDVVVEFRLEKDNQTLSSGSDTIYLGKFEEKTETTSIYLPSNVAEGTYTFIIETDLQGYKTRSHKIIKVELESIIVYRLSDLKDKCIELEILEADRIADDYDTLTECEFHIVIPHNPTFWDDGVSIMAGILVLVVISAIIIYVII